MSLVLWKYRKQDPAAMSGGISLHGQPGRWFRCVRFDQGMRAAQLGKNLWLNPDVEIDFSNLTPVATASGTALRSTDEACYGIASAKTLMTDSGGSAEVVGLYHRFGGVFPATSYQFGAYLKPTILNSSKARARMIGYDSGGTATGTVTADLGTITANDWAWAKCRLMVPADSATVDMYAELVSTAANATGLCHWDGFYFGLNNADADYWVPLIMGSQADSAWTDAAHASTSVRANPTLYYDVDGIGDSAWTLTRFRTPPGLDNARGAQYTVLHLNEASGFLPPTSQRRVSRSVAQPQVDPPVTCEVLAKTRVG